MEEPIGTELSVVDSWKVGGGGIPHRSAKIGKEKCFSQRLLSDNFSSSRTE